MLCDAAPRAARERCSLVDLFGDFAERPGEFLEYDDGYRRWTYSYAQVGSAAHNFAARLRDHGIGRNEKVVFWSENRPEWVAAFWGCLLGGVVVVPIDYRASPAFLRRVQEMVNARLILTGEEVRLPAWEGQPPVWRLSELAWEGAGRQDPWAPVNRDDLAEIVFTSGATGEPKGVLITHRNILANIVSPQQIIAKYRRWFAPMFPLRFLSLIPLSHMFGQVLALFLVPQIPGVVVFMRGYNPHEIVRRIRGRRVSVVVAVPKLLEVLREHVLRTFPEASEPAPAGLHWTLRWWRFRRVHHWLGWKFWAFVVGAAPLPAELEQFWSRLGFAVIQGYGLTETAPVVAFNNPFDIRSGTVGRPVAGVEVKLAPDGEILVRGESVTSGYYQAPEQTAAAFESGWFRTGDIGEFDESGRLRIRGRKKEVIVTPEGLNVFPEDVERVLNRTPGVRESAVVGRDRVHAVLVLEPGITGDEIVRGVNPQLEDHQKIRGVSLWPGARLPRTEGTEKIKHGEVQRWLESGEPAAPPLPSRPGLVDVIRKYAPGRPVTPETTLDELGLSSLDRVELMMDLEQHFDASLEESALMGARKVADLASLRPPARAFDFPAWNRGVAARAVRRAGLAALWLPLTRFFARLHTSGREHLAALDGPVVFVSNHQSHLDTPAILAALPPRYRYRMAVAMWKEYFDAHFSPERHTRRERWLNSFAYWLVTLFFNAFPLPQTEAGARESLRYLGELVSEEWSILFFPEGQRTEAGEISAFQPGVGLIASRLGVPVVPVRLRGLEKVLHRTARWPRPGRVELVFGPPLRLRGEDYATLARQVERAVAAL